EFNHNVLNENDIIAKIAELYPDFKRGLNENFDSISNEQEFHSNNLNDYKMSPHDSKQKEKYLQREKKARLRWFSYMLCKYTDKKINSECSNYEAFSKTNHAQIDDMQQNFLPNLPEYNSLNTVLGQPNLSWLADSLQTIEFVANFGTSLLKSFADSHDHHTDLSILTSVKNFYQALKNVKHKKELNELVQMMLKILLDEQTADISDEFDTDQDYLVAQIRLFDITEWTFSEILRLYFVKCLKNLKSHRDTCSFDIDITSDLEQKIQLFVQELESNHFDMLKIETKAAILAHLSDDLLQNSSFLQSSSLDQELRRPNAISESIEETLDQLSKLRQDKVQINHKIRHSPQLDEKMHQQKQIAQEEISGLQRQLRSGQCLGQDRFRRLYWKLNSFKPIIIQSYYQGNLQDTSCLHREVSDVVNDMVDQVESNLENEKIVQKYSHLIELNQEPFDLKIKSDQAEFLSLNFSDIEILVRNIFFNLNGKKNSLDHLSNQHGSSDKWWLFDKNCSDILSSLSSHGFREKILLKNLAQLDQIGPDENFVEHLDFNQVKQMRNDRAKVLKQIMNLENKVYSANLQLAQSGPDKVNCEPESSDENQLTKCARERLLKLEQSIDKRYLRYPFSFRKKLGNYKLKISNETDQVLLEKVEQNLTCGKINLSIKLNQDIRTYMKKIDANRKEGSCVNVTNELLRWRRLVSSSRTSSQIMIYLNELNKYIEWDKSIMKASCHICSMDDNEESLLLCDNCDLGYHTYCFRPKIERIPDGDWYCFKCIGKFLGNKQMCYVCGRDSTVPNENEKQILNKCEKCLCIFHGKCMPNAKLFKTTFKWHCVNCLSNKNKIVKLDDAKITECDRVPKKRGRKRKYPLTDENVAIDDSKKVKNHAENDVETPNDSVKKISLSERLTLKKVKQQNESDLHKCRILLNELIRNKYSNYFMVKVSEKEYPDYYEIIKEPIDLKTIKEKLKGKMYENKERFAYDCRLIFDNCECFNEDNSQIGQAGHKLRAFFETKWLKLFD
ncbi:bromodomain adjacent to zinc finger domain 2B-like, partial [Brachionus plicatilis]